MESLSNNLNAPKLYFHNPISLIIFKTIYYDFEAKLLAHYIVNKSDFPKYDLHYHDLNFFWFEQAKLLCNELNIGLEDFQDSLPETSLTSNSIIYDTSALKNKVNRYSLILEGSDSYCVFGFRHYYMYPFKKIRLVKNWKNALDLNSRPFFYIFNPMNFSVAYPNVQKVNLDTAKKILIEVSKNMVPKVLRNTLTNDNYYLLVLPPRKEHGVEFFNKFIEEAIRISRSEGLKILLKPHRNDEMDYTEYFANEHFVFIDHPYFKFINVEFLFTIENIKKIISVPSSALIFAEKDKLKVFIPKDKKLMRRRYLDQLICLAYWNIQYFKI